MGAFIDVTYDVTSKPKKMPYSRRIYILPVSTGIKDWIFPYLL